MMTATRPLFHALLATSALALAACGGAQTGGGSTDDCGRIRGEMTAAQLEGATACHRRANTEYSAEQCREVVEFGAVATPPALRDAAACVLQSETRSDGVWLADMMYAVQEDGLKLAALADSFAGDFDPAIHGVTWTSSIAVDTQEALGGVLRRLDPDARSAMVSLVLAYQVQPLARLSAPYLDDLTADDPGARAYADQLAASGEALNAEERSLLLATGAWTARDALTCYDGELDACEEWEGESPLAALAEMAPEDIEVGHPSTPNAAISALRSPDIDPESARGLAALVGGAEYDNRDALLPSMMLDMTDGGFRPEIRRAIAEAATGPMCEYDAMRDFLMRAQTSDPTRFDDAEAVWPVFVRNCDARHWSQDDRFAALSAGSWLGVPMAQWETLLARLGSELADTSCDEIRALGQAAYNRTPWVITRGTATVVAARIGGDRCRALFDDDVEALQDDRNEHPEVRLAAMAYRISVDDDACSDARSVSGILDWVHPEYETGPGRWAADYGQQIAAECR